MNPIEDLVVRTVPEEVEKELIVCCCMLDELVNVGSNILVNDKNVIDWIDNTPTMMFRNFIELVDSISILIKNSSPDTARILLRSLVESYFSLYYVLIDDTRQRCKAFIVADMIDQSKLIQKIIDRENGSERKVNLSSGQYSLQEINDSRLNVLKSQDFKEVYEEFETLIKKSKGKITPPWYKAFKGPSNIREMSISINQQEFYDKLYSVLSADTHSVNVISGKTSTDENGELGIHQLRCWDNVRLVTDNAINLSIKLFRIYVNQRTPTFSNKYNEWEKDYLSRISKQLTSLIQVVSKY